MSRVTCGAKGFLSVSLLFGAVFCLVIVLVLVLIVVSLGMAVAFFGI
jgi:hypothetical protein